MEETLTDCLVRVREDLSQLKKVRAYLDTNAETEERCSVTWRTIEAFNSILSVCSSQNSPETSALDTLLDSFYYLARNNSDESVWDDFGFELGIICVKVLSAIERSDIFEILFCKLLSVISIICENNSNVWKAAARQILNVLINKKFSLSYLEAIVKLYICILKNIDSAALREFSTQNLHLLKTLSLLVQKVGDFEIQSSVIELVFLHLSKNKKFMLDFFSTAETKLFKTLQFTDFEHDCRMYLNAVNKPRRGFDRKVYSISSHFLQLGGCFMDPPMGKNCIWVDANKDSERISIRCGDENQIILIQLSEILKVQLEEEKTDNRVTIQTKNLSGVYKDARNDDVCLVTDNKEEALEFVRFLQTTIDDRKKKKRGGRGSKTMDSLLIERNNPKLEVQDNAITSSEKPSVEHILPDVLSLFEKANQTTEEQKRTTPPQNQQLSPNSFVASLNKHIGLGSPELRHTCEDSVDTIEFLQKSTPASHKLFRSPHEIFEISENKQSDFNFNFGENKENEVLQPKIKTYSRKTRKSPLVLRDNRNIEITNMQSQDYFRTGFTQKKKPTLPKLKRSTKNNIETNEKTADHSKISPKNKTKNENDAENSKVIPKKVKNRQQEVKKPKENQSERHTKFIFELEVKEKRKTKQKSSPKQEVESSNQVEKTEPSVKPSLLDPNGYAYQRWCKPTTSERSNFWLKKLNAAEKSKIDSDSVFDFFEDSESVMGRKKHKKRVVRSKPKASPKQTSLRHAKEILKKLPPKPKTSPREKPQKAAPSPQPTIPPQTVIGLSDQVSKRSSSPESLAFERPPERPVDSEYETLSEDEEDTKKRELSEEDCSMKRQVKKKSKITLPKNLLLTLQRRLRKTEEKDRQQTDEIIQAVNKATNHLFNHLQRKDGERAVTYLKTAEETSKEFVAQIDDLNLRMKRIQRAILYYRAGCSLADFYELLEGQMSKVRNALKDFREKKDSLKTIDRVSVRLSDLIKSGIERSIGNEWASKRDQLLRCATILGVDFRELG